jgi:iron complex outermembrane receptor protein
MNNSWKKSTLFVALCGSASIMPMSAHAQVQGGAAPQAQDEQSPKKPNAEQDADGDIVVTAQRREERLKDVPISITALSSAVLERAGVSDTTALAIVTPGLLFPRNGAYAQPAIRGIGTNLTSGEANVAIYVDGVYMPSQNANFFQLPDVQQIDVLKGPQGTLYGRNSTGGAINITTVAPTSEPHLRLRASYGNFNQVDLSGNVSGPIAGDKLAGSLTGFYYSTNGYAKDVLRGTNPAATLSYGGRAKLRWTVSDSSDITFAFDASRYKDGTSYSLKVLGGNTNVPGATIPSGPRNLALSFDPYFDTRQLGASMTAKFELPFAVLTNIISYRGITFNTVVDTDRTPNRNQYSSFDIHQKTYTEELNITSPGGRPLQWTAGIYLLDDISDLTKFISSGAVVLNSSKIEAKAAAIYLQGDYKILPQLTFTAGLRYSTETKTLDVGRAINPLQSEKTWNALTPRLALRYAINNFSNIYLSWTRGFKSGAYNQTSPSVTPVDPENVDAIEAGYKYGRGSTIVSLAAFRYDYRDIQVNAYNPGGLSVFTNAARAKIYGGEVQAGGQVAPGLRVDGGAAWIHAKYDSFPTATVFVPLTTAAQCGTNPNRPCGNAQTLFNASGKSMVRAPGLTANLGFSYVQPAFGGNFELSAIVYHNGGFYWTPSNRVRQAPYQLLNASIAWSPNGGKLRFSIWGKNLTDTLYVLYEAETAAGDSVSYAAPRTIGAAVELKF